MPLSQTTITGSIRTPADAEAPVSEVIFRLIGSDFEGPELVAVKPTPATVTEGTGDFTVTLWPNDRGLSGNTRYSVSFRFADDSEVTNITQIFVKHSASTKSLGLVVAETVAASQLKGFNTVIMTAAAYAALTTRSPNTAYIIWG